MAASGTKRSSERRSEHLLNDLLDTQGWDRRRPPLGDVLFQQEYRSHPELALLLRGSSKSGSGFGVPEALIVERSSRVPLAVIEAKAKSSEIDTALVEAKGYALPLVDAGYHPLAIGLAGVDAYGVRGSNGPASATHFAMATDRSIEEVFAIAGREGWPAKYRKRGDVFGVIECWIEGSRMIEILTPEMQRDYRAAMTIDNWKAMLAHNALVMA